VVIDPFSIDATSRSYIGISIGIGQPDEQQAPLSRQR